MRSVTIAGVGMTPFGKHPDRSLASLSAEAVDAALADADVERDEVAMILFGNAAAGLLSGQEMIRGQVALKDCGFGGVPIANVENACASGGTAAHLAWLAVASGHVDVALAVGAEKLIHPDKQRSFDAIEAGTDLSIEVGEQVEGSIMMSAYARKAREYGAAHGGVEHALAAIAVKNRAFAAANPNAQFRVPITAADVRDSRLVADPLRLLTCSPLTDGGAAVVFRAAQDAGDRDVAVEACVLRSNRREVTTLVGDAAADAYAAAGVTPADVDVFALHDASAYAELAQYEQIGIAEPGEGRRLAVDGLTGPDGPTPVNTDGGLLSRGHALGATGLAQLVELTGQVRHEAPGLQIGGARRALAVNGGGWMGEDYASAVVTVLARR